MGEAAAVATAFLFAFSSIFFASISKQVGSIISNRMRLLFASVILFAVHLIFTGHVFPVNAEPYRWLWLSLSGLVGLAIGDTFLFQCYIHVGNRLGTLLMASVPVFSSLGAWLLLGETLGIFEILGMFFCLFGIVMVILERRNGDGSNPSATHTRRQYITGILYGLASAVCQASGLILAKKGLGGDFPSISGVVIRMISATIVLWILTLITGQAKTTINAVFQNKKALRTILAGTMVGPVFGVWLSLISVQYAPVGISSTLTALTPIIMLPIAKWGYKENINARVVIWTLTALAGTAIIFLK